MLGSTLSEDCGDEDVLLITRMLALIVLVVLRESEHERGRVRDDAVVSGRSEYSACRLRW